MLRIEKLTTIQGREMPAFFVRNGSNKIIALGAFNHEMSFVTMAATRYAADLTLCQAVAKLTGLAPKWNIAYYCREVSSRSQQLAEKRYRDSRRKH